MPNVRGRLFGLPVGWPLVAAGRVWTKPTAKIPDLGQTARWATGTSSRGAVGGTIRLWPGYQHGGGTIAARTEALRGLKKFATPQRDGNSRVPTQKTIAFLRTNRAFPPTNG